MIPVEPVTNSRRWQIGLVVLSFGLSACSMLTTQDQAAQLTEEDVRSELISDGSSNEVADCIIRLAEGEIVRGSYDSVLRAELEAACAAAQDVIADNDSTGGDGVVGVDGTQDLAFVDGPSNYGDDPALDQLWDQCEDGSGAACDELFNTSPLDSGYEQFGLTCGDRPDVAKCSDLDEAEKDPVPLVATTAEPTDRR